MLICSQYTVNFGHPHSESESQSQSDARTCGELLVTWAETHSQHSISVSFYYYFALLRLLCGQQFLVLPFQHTFLLLSSSPFCCCCCCCLFVTFSYQLFSFMLRCTLGRVLHSPLPVLSSVLFSFPVVIRWHITLKCLLLFYKINFFRYLARPTCLSAKKERPTKSHKNNNVMPISFTATFINQEEGTEAAAACGMFYLPSESFRVEVLGRCVCACVCVLGVLSSRGNGNFWAAAEKICEQEGKLI